jgi:2-phospho-L-lactate guanylyltransferase (CobY/MobA/RfbA family)
MRMDAQGVATVAVLLSALRAVNLVAVQGVATVSTAVGKLKGFAVPVSGTSTVTVAIRARRAIAVSVGGTSSANLTVTARRAISVNVGGTSSVFANLDQESAAVTIPTGKYRPEHDSALIDLNASTGFSSEHRSALSDLFDAGG